MLFLVQLKTEFLTIDLNFDSDSELAPMPNDWKMQAAL
jgi:hypothetical protein